MGFANLQVEFVDRESALRLTEEWARRGTGLPKVVYGPEGCGKTAWLLQSVELLKDYGFEVIYVNPLNKVAIAEIGITSLREEFTKLVRGAISQNALGRLTWLAFDMAKELIRATRGRVAILADDVFQVIGVKESAMYVKALLNLIEYPPERYERIVTIAATSEGMSLHEIGRHSWSDTAPMWNMGREGFEQLYEQIPGNKPDFDHAWRLTGGNPRTLERLYERDWNTDEAINSLIKEKGLSHAFIRRWRDHLKEAINDPDYLWFNAPEELINELVERNLIVYFLLERRQGLWIDQPPPERDLELGIGRYVAWQSPLHREAVKMALESVRP